MAEKNAKIGLLIVLITYIFIAIIFDNHDKCTHLSGMDYDSCHMAQVKGR